MARRKLSLRTIGINGSFILLCAVFLGASLLPFLPTSFSQVGQTMPDGKSVQFIPGASSEWWVQVQILGDGGAEATGIDVRATDGPWMPLEKQNWTMDGSWWAKSVHIPEAGDMQFRITTPTVSNFESCWYTHPAGDERCD